MKKIKIPLLYLLSFILSVGPVATYFFMNMDRYIGTATEGIKLGAGAIILLVIAFLKVIGKLRVPSRVYLFGLVFILCYLLHTVLKDILVFSLLALVGELLDCLCQLGIRRARAQRDTEKTAQKTAQEIQRLLNGRV